MSHTFVNTQARIRCLRVFQLFDCVDYIPPCAGMPSQWWPISQCTLWPGCSFTSRLSTLWTPPSQTTWARWTSLCSGWEERCQAGLYTPAKSLNSSPDLSVCICRHWLSSCWELELYSPSYSMLAQKRIRQPQREMMNGSDCPPHRKLCLVPCFSGSTGWRSPPSTRWVLNLCWGTLCWVRRFPPSFSHSLFLLIVFKAKMSTASWFQLL